MGNSVMRVREDCFEVKKWVLCMDSVLKFSEEICGSNFVLQLTFQCNFVGPYISKAFIHFCDFFIRS